MRYVKAKYSVYTKELAYRIYIADTLYYKGENKRLTVRYLDMISKAKPQDNRTGDEIAIDIIKKLGLKGI